MSELEPGRFVLVDYGEWPRCVHQRLVGAHVADSDYVIITPDCGKWPGFGPG